MIDFIKKLLDPKVQVFIVGLLTALAAVADALTHNAWLQGYPDVIGFIGGVSVGVTYLLRFARTLVVGSVRK